MKRLLYIVTLIVVITSCGNKKKGQQTDVRQQVIPAVFSDSLRFCESTLWNDDILLIANFGTETLNPLNNEGKGYIAGYRNGNVDIFIPADGFLSGPKGMAVKDGYLFICDVNKMVIYNLNALKAAPFILTFPEGELFVNDIVILDNSLYVSVTNTGNIYTLDVTDPAETVTKPLTLYTNIPGANGMVSADGKIYVASYPADGVTKDENVIYVINNIASPKPEKLIGRAGQYDGLALSGDKQILYFTSWVNGEIGQVNLNTREVSLIPVAEQMTGPADMTLQEDRLYIPDLPNSKIVVVDLK